MRIELPIKPLSVNKAWCGRRFKTKEYKDYELEVGLLLNQINIQTIYRYVRVEYTFYLINWKRADVDNGCKLLTDILVKHKVIEDDRFIMEMRARKIPSNKDYVGIKIVRTRGGE